ncbi:extensin-like protein [Cinnamomum micranthum f. kanehirae]|uniref:Extensin-like protein n=1 Tax=Cinnamomum micranthum f. kanehirae TaxID=337451 RepID=A0A443PCM3_9MAGN|nr:extensin-like protein [Cinnamomum micranthum f. kanehirae]
MLFKCFERRGLGSVPKRKPLHAMKVRKDCMKLCVVVVYVSIAASLFIHCDARIPRYSMGKHHQGNRQARSLTIKVPNKLKALNHFDLNNPYLDEYNANAPNSMPSFDDTMGSLPPSYLSQNTPPYCVYPPFTPLPPSTTVPTPIVYAQPPPPSSVLTPSLPFQNPPPGVIPNPPIYSPTPPEYMPGPPGFEPSPPGFAPIPPGFEPSPPSFEPSPPEYVPGPPEFEPSPPEYVPSPPQFEPSPPEYVPGPPVFEPSPPGFVPGPPEFEPSPPGYIPSPPESIPSPSVFLPPVVFPPPAVPPQGSSGPGIPLWCVAKPTVPDPIIQEAMNYACASGADCESILPDGSCYNPDKLISHASYAFNSYWQRTKATGGTCDFGGTAILITKDPSFDGCHFLMN